MQMSLPWGAFTISTPATPLILPGSRRSGGRDSTRSGPGVVCRRPDRSMAENNEAERSHENGALLPNAEKKQRGNKKTTDRRKSTRHIHACLQGLEIEHNIYAPNRSQGPGVSSYTPSRWRLTRGTRGDPHPKIEPPSCWISSTSFTVRSTGGWFSSQNPANPPTIPKTLTVFFGRRARERGTAQPRKNSAYTSTVLWRPRLVWFEAAINVSQKKWRSTYLGRPALFNRRDPEKLLCYPGSTGQKGAKKIKSSFTNTEGLRQRGRLGEIRPEKTEQ